MKRIYYDMITNLIKYYHNYFQLKALFVFQVCWSLSVYVWVIYCQELLPVSSQSRVKLRTTGNGHAHRVRASVPLKVKVILLLVTFLTFTPTRFTILKLIMSLYFPRDFIFVSHILPQFFPAQNYTNNYLHANLHYAGKLSAKLYHYTFYINEYNNILMD